MMEGTDTHRGSAAYQVVVFWNHDRIRLEDIARVMGLTWEAAHSNGSHHYLFHCRSRAEFEELLLLAQIS